MSKLTITEALAELPTIMKRVEKKEEFIRNYLFRQEAVRDPLEPDGGSPKLIVEAQQAINDLQRRYVNIRLAIQKANQENTISIGEKPASIAEWLVWRREIADRQVALLQSMNNMLTNMRKNVQQKGQQVLEKDSGKFSQDMIVNINEKALVDNIESIENILGTLDGQLSLKNATITIDVP